MAFPGDQDGSKCQIHRGLAQERNPKAKVQATAT